jgi:hypothetical protein
MQSFERDLHHHAMQSEALDQSALWTQSNLLHNFGGEYQKKPMTVVKQLLTPSKQ